MNSFPNSILYLHFYKEYSSWAIVFSITMRNASFQLGPFWLSIRYPWSEY